MVLPIFPFPLIISPEQTSAYNFFFHTLCQRLPLLDIREEVVQPLSHCMLLLA
jgi:hypothetical protein